MEIGKKIPSFELDDENGKIVKSSELIGVKTIIYFYPRDFTPGCTIEADEFTKNYETFQKKNIRIIGISKDDVKSHKKFCEKIGIKYKLLSDPNAIIAKKFGAWGLKKFMGKEYEGVLRNTYLVNEHGIIFKIFEHVKPRNHVDEVVNAFINK